MNKKQKEEYAKELGRVCADSMFKLFSDLSNRGSNFEYPETIIKSSISWTKTQCFLHNIVKCEAIAVRAAKDRVKELVENHDGNDL